MAELQQIGVAAGHLSVQVTALVPLHVHVPVLGLAQLLHACPGWPESAEHPPHPFTPASPLLQVTEFMPEHAHVPPPHVPHGIPTVWGSAVHPPHALAFASGLEHETWSASWQLQVPPLHVPQGEPG
jgi:hypothetical protein